MLNDTQKGKIERFLQDEVAVEAVRNVLERSFLKPQKEWDIYKLAAARLAVDLLDDGFKELNKLRKVETDIKTNTQIGL